MNMVYNYLHSVHYSNHHKQNVKSEFQVDVHNLTNVHNGGNLW
jgi:hypothetical protein